MVYHEAHQMIDDVIAREKQLKGRSRAQKVKLINGINPNWLDLFDDLNSLRAQRYNLSTESTNNKHIVSLALQCHLL